MSSEAKIVAVRTTEAMKSKRVKDTSLIATDRRHAAFARACCVTATLPARLRYGTLAARSSSVTGECPTEGAKLQIVLVPDLHTTPRDLAFPARTIRESY